MRSLASQKRTPKKTSLAVALLVLFVVAGAGVAGTFLWFKINDKQVNNTSTPSDTAGNNGPTKQDLATPAPSEDASNVPVQEDITIVITKLSQEGGMVQVEGTVTGADEGKCVADFKSSDQIMRPHEAKLKDGTCTFAIDEIQFSYLGEWTLTLTYFTPQNTSKAESQAKTITIH